MIEEEIVTRVLDDLKILIIGEWSKFYGFYNNFELRKISVVVEAAVAAETIDMEIDAVSRFYLVYIFFLIFCSDDRGYGDRGGYGRGGYDDRRGGGGYDDRRGGYDDRRGGGYDDRRGGYDDRRGGGGFDRDRGYGGGRDRYDDRRGYDDRRYDDRRNHDRYDSYQDGRGGYDRGRYRSDYDTSSVVSI